MIRFALTRRALFPASQTLAVLLAAVLLVTAIIERVYRAAGAP